MMKGIREFEGRLDGAGKSFGIVASRFNGELVEKLVFGARKSLEGHGVEPDDIHIARVPGAWEIPQGLRILADARDPDALIAIGVVIRGETPHFDYICGVCSSGVAAVEKELSRPVTFGVLTCETWEQAEARSGGEAGNKGEEAALAALEMADLPTRLAERA